MQLSKSTYLLAAMLVPYLGVPLFAAEVYKSVDANGHVVYSDHPDPAAQKLDVRVDEPQAAEVARIAKEQKLLKVEDSERKRLAALEDKQKAQQEHDRELRCEKARSRYYSLKDSRRVYGRDGDGNRVYYSDKDADAQRAAAQQAMQTECGS
jgi:multidrug efflux pump subunit AcrA (membrane-fusion protein)